MSLPKNAKTKDVSDAVGAVMNGRKTAVVFCGNLSKVTHRVRATHHGKSNSVLVTIGRPNYAERKFLKRCKKAGVRPRRFWFP